MNLVFFCFFPFSFLALQLWQVTPERKFEVERKTIDPDSWVRSSVSSSSSSCFFERSMSLLLRHCCCSSNEYLLDVSSLLFFISELLPLVLSRKEANKTCQNCHHGGIQRTIYFFQDSKSGKIKMYVRVGQNMTRKKGGESSYVRTSTASSYSWERRERERRRAIWCQKLRRGNIWTRRNRFPFFSYCYFFFPVLKIDIAKGKNWAGSVLFNTSE